LYFLISNYHKNKETEVMPFPVILFDKSFLHGINPKEAKVLNYLFSTNITPELFMEI
jgi:hypothetical protein